MAVNVHAPGLWTTIQDLGRWGYQSLGVPVAGPMDAWSHRLSNVAAGNDPDAPSLEVTLVGPRLEFDTDAHVAVTGAAFDLRVGAETLRTPVAFPVAAGTVLAFGERRRGTRAYVAVSGGIDVPAVLGSRATDVRSRIGGIDGRALRAGDVLELGRFGGRQPRTGELPSRTLTTQSDVCRLRVLPGLQAGAVGRDAFAALLAASFVVSTRSDRMGYRLEGGVLPTLRDGTMISSPTVAGAVQVPPGGQPILLMADRQTTGGYPILAVVIAADLSRAGQLAPGQRVCFVSSTSAEASAAAAEEEHLLTSWLESAR